MRAAARPAAVQQQRAPTHPPPAHSTPHLIKHKPKVSLVDGLKGLSHEIDQKNVDLNLKNLAQLRDATGFEFFRGSNDFIVQKFIYCGQCQFVFA